VVCVVGQNAGGDHNGRGARVRIHVHGRKSDCYLFTLVHNLQDTTNVPPVAKHRPIDAACRGHDKSREIAS
jgi:hypothetical protein